jgi:hypothetical protein
MKLKNAIETSDYSTALLEYNNLYTVVDGNEDGYRIKTGVQGMPVTESQTVGTLDEAINVIADKELNTDGWIPIGEDGEPQE